MYICSVPLARGDAEQLELARLGAAQLALAPRAADLLGARALGLGLGLGTGLVLVLGLGLVFVQLTCVCV